MQNRNWFYSRCGPKTAETPKMELVMTIVNGFYLLSIFLKLSVLDFCGSSECASTGRLYVTKSSILDISLYLRSAYTTNSMILFFKMAILCRKLCHSYKCNDCHFQNTQTQGNLVKGLHLSCCSSPRSATFQICARKRSEENFSFKSFKIW